MYNDLIALAELIARIDSGKPKQANLRRAVSTAYYAVFHCLIDEACRAQMGNQHSQQGFRRALGRAYSHTTMKLACSSYSGGTLKRTVSKGLPLDANGDYAIPKPIQELASLFVEVQQKRHVADYDLSETFKRSEVLSLIEQVQLVIDEFLAMPPSDDRKFFLATLWAWRELANR